MKRLLILTAALIVPAGAGAGTEDVQFPADYKRAHVRYATVDKSHPQRGPSVRDLYATPEALKALKAGKPLPSGTVLTMEVYKARADGKKTPVRDAKGRFVKDKLFGIFVMEKRTGWGAAYPASLRNGEWEYARFTAAGARHAKPSMTACFACHKRKAKDDFVFSLKQLRARAAR